MTDLADDGEACPQRVGFSTLVEEDSGGKMCIIVNDLGQKKCMAE